MRCANALYIHRFFSHSHFSKKSPLICGAIWTSHMDPIYPIMILKSERMVEELEKKKIFYYYYF
jgi:hypothetical protein